MNNFTPGPWEFSQAKSKTMAFIAMAGKLLIFKSKISDADGQLIAAAPDLLEALEGLFASYKQLADSGDAGNWSVEELPEGVKALAAIARAKGESN